MSTPRVRTVAALLAGLALSVLPAAAQEARQDQGGSRNDRPRAERRRGRESGDGGQANAQRAERSQARRAERSQAQRAEPSQPQRAEPSQAQRNDNNDNQNENRRQAVPRGENRGRNDVQRNANRNNERRADRNNGPRADRNDWNRNNGNRNNGNNNWNNGYRGRDRGRPYVVRPSGPSYRYYNSPRRSYVVPYGYRPYGRRPGWSLNLYFGSPYAYRSGGYYNRGYNQGNYGYYAIPQGFAYGSLRIVDAPRDAQVFVDGYYAGVVDDYDGVFQRLNLEPGEHQLEVEPYPGAPPLSYDVYVEPGRTVTVHVRP